MNKFNQHQKTYHIKTSNDYRNIRNKSDEDYSKNKNRAKNGKMRKIAKLIQ